MADIKSLKAEIGNSVTLQGWVSNKRTGKGLVFIVLRDGSGFCQCVVSEDSVSEEHFNSAKSLTLESSVTIVGNVVADDRQIGGVEVQATELSIIHIAEEFPIAKKEHGVEFLLNNRHLWLRSKRQWAIQRVRNSIIMNIHKFFQAKGFVQTDAPIFTGNACEGTTNLFETDFYGDPAYLSQSGQLYGEAIAMAMGKIYTFGPTFRAEKSKTRRHLSEFWMIEPEMAYYTNEMNMDLIEDFLRSVVLNVIEECPTEFEVLERDLDTLKKVAEPFIRLSYDEAIEILKGNKAIEGRTTLELLDNELKDITSAIQEKTAEVEEREANIAAGGMKKGAINFNRNTIDRLKNEIFELEEQAKNIPQWRVSAEQFEHGNDLGGSDETVLTKMFGKPVMVYNWPTPIKAFYMKEKEGDPNYVKGVDVLAPEGYGEIVGGAERETDIEVLKKKIIEHDLPMEAFEWYLDLRRYGSVPHAGFGLGLERLVAWICKLGHVRETIAFPRMYGRLLP